MTTSTWRATLDRFEDDVELGVRLLHAAAAAGADEVDLPGLPRWEPPTGLGPLPRDLLDRARSIARRQEAVERDLGEAMRRARQQRDVTHRINGGASRRDVPPAYLNLQA